MVCNIGINDMPRGWTEKSELNKRLYKIWSAMKQRCYYKNSIEYYNYGGRGIKVCEEWKNNFISC